MENKILNWLANGHTGVSSKTMAFTALGVKLETVFHTTPSDPADLNRCLLLEESVPEIRQAFPAIKALSQKWAAVIDHWDELKSLFLEEVGRDWSKSQNAPKTYKRMKALGL